MNISYEKAVTAKRESQGLKAKHIARKGGLSIDTIYNCERGKNIEIHTAKIISKALGIDEDSEADELKTLCLQIMLESKCSKILDEKYYYISLEVITPYNYKYGLEGKCSVEWLRVTIDNECIEELYELSEARNGDLKQFIKNNLNITPVIVDTMSRLNAFQKVGGKALILKDLALEHMLYYTPLHMPK